MLNVRVKKALLTILTACLTVLMMVGAVLGFAPTMQTAKADPTKQFVKVTDAPADWSGTYLIVYEDAKKAFDGSLTADKAKNTVDVTISDEVIAYTDTLNDSTFTIEKNGTSGYLIKSASGYYIGSTSSSSNKTYYSTSTKYNNTITLNNDDTAHIVSSANTVLRFNSGTSEMRFRYFKSSSWPNQKAITLYKLVEVGSGSGSEAPACEHENAEDVWVNPVAGEHKKQTICPDCNTVLEVIIEGKCSCSEWGDWTTAKSKHSRTGECDTCGAEMTESGDCVYERISNDDNSATYECKTCGDTYTNLKYTITFHVPGGIAPVAARLVEQGKTEALPTKEDVGSYEGYTFAGWTTEAGYNDTTSPAIYANYTMGNANVHLYALYTYTETTGATGYVKVTSASQLAVNDKVVIVASDYDYALSTTQNKNNRGQAGVEKDGDTITFGEDVQLITLEKGTAEGTFAFNVGDGYLYAAGASSNNYLRTGDLDENGSWKIEISNSVATIKAQNEKTRNQLLYNKTSSLFSCYSGPSNDAKVVCLYRLASGTTHYLTDIGPKIAYANLTIGETLTMNYKVAMNDSFKDAVMEFTFLGNTIEVAGEKNADGLYVYSLQIAPQHMGEEIDAELKKLDGTVLTSMKGHSVKAYAEYQLANSNNETLKQLVADMLLYGAAAQVYTNYDVENLVADLANLGAAPTTTDFELVNELAEGSTYPAYFVGAGVRFGADNKIFVELSTVENVTLEVNGEEVELNGTTYYTEGLKATQFGDTFTFELYCDGVLMQTLTYSVNAYAYQFAGGDDAMANLAIALYNYGMSAENYVA